MYIRVGKVIRNEEDGSIMDHPSINAAKRKSRELQANGEKLSRSNEFPEFKGDNNA